MDFNLSKQQELIRQLMHDFAENEVKPLAAEIDDTEQFPVETVRKMAKYGMLGINIPAQYGGAGGDTLSYIIAIEELAKVCATTQRTHVACLLSHPCIRHRRAEAEVSRSPCQG